MAQTTTNYGLLKPESTDNYNHLVYDNPNMDTIDATMKANADAAVTTASCIKSGTTHTITRTNTDASVMRFTATGDWNTGDTMIVDGVTVTPYLPNGDALIDKAFLINTEVLMSLSGVRATVYTNANIASNIEYSAGTTVAQAIASASTAAGTEYAAGVSVEDMLTVNTIATQEQLDFNGNACFAYTYGKLLVVNLMINCTVTTAGYKDCLYIPNMSAISDANFALTAGGHFIQAYNSGSGIMIRFAGVDAGGQRGQIIVPIV